MSKQVRREQQRAAAMGIENVPARTVRRAQANRNAGRNPRA